MVSSRVVRQIRVPGGVGDTGAWRLSHKRPSLLKKAVSIAAAAVQVPCTRFIGCRIGANRGVRVGERLLQSQFSTFSTGCLVFATDGGVRFVAFRGCRSSDRDDG